MSEEKDKDKDKKPTDITATQATAPATTPTEGEKKEKEVTITVKHEFVKPAETPASKPEETPKVEEKPAEKSESVEELKKKLEDVTKSKEEVDAILAALALKEFETDREALAKRVTDPKKKAEIEQIDDPDKLKEATFEINKNEFLAPVKDETKRKELMDMIKEPEDLQRAKIMEVMMRSAYEQYGGGVKPAEGSGEKKPEDEGIEPVPPSNPKVRGAAPATNITTEAIKARINEVYDILADPTKSQKEKDVANAEINEYWKMVREGAKKAGVKTIELLPTMECPKCHTIFSAPKGAVPTCPTCGWTGSKFQEW